LGGEHPAKRDSAAEVIGFLKEVFGAAR
jgi:hypothetical protein